jgi:hypothetical protein
MTDKKPMTPSERIRHNLGAFQMFLMAGRDEGAQSKVIAPSLRLQFLRV